MSSSIHVQASRKQSVKISRLNQPRKAVRLSRQALGPAARIRLHGNTPRCSDQAATSHDHPKKKTDEFAQLLSLNPGGLKRDGLSVKGRILRERDKSHLDSLAMSFEMRCVI